MITRLFDTIARAIYSLGLVTFVMLFVITSMIFFSHTLFLQVFPDSMADWERQTGTWLMALGWESTVLVTMCNPKYIGTKLPAFMAMASGCIVLFFIQAFDFSQEPIIIIQRWFIGSLAGTINYVFPKIFHKKYTEERMLAALPAQLQQSESDVVQLRADLLNVRAEVQQRDATVLELRAQLKERDRDVKQLTAALEKYEAELKCDWCGSVQRSESSLRSHKGHCEKSPKRNLQAV